MQILPEESTQADVYQSAVSSVVEDVMRGYNGTIMAYGQTGAGKTYTLSSIQPDAIGMIPRAAAEVFASIAGDPANEYSIFMSYIQIYMELIQVTDSSHAQGLWHRHRLLRIGKCSVSMSYGHIFLKLKQALQHVMRCSMSGMHEVWPGACAAARAALNAAGWSSDIGCTSCSLFPESSSILLQHLQPCLLCNASQTPHT